MALKQNLEGLFDCPGYSEKGEEVQRLLESMFQINGFYSNGVFKSKPLMTFLTKHDEDVEISENESVFSD